MNRKVMKTHTNGRRQTNRQKAVSQGHEVPAECVRSAGLRHTTDTQPGIRRRRSGLGFAYTDASGRTIRDRSVIRRIRELAIPGAWTDVWINPSAIGHIQATGRDSKGRKQYLYHSLWKRISGEVKFHRMVRFGESLPGIRRRTEDDLTLRGMAKAKVLAAVVRLLERTLIRIGNREYTRENNSFGLTTMRSDHLDISGSRLRFRFRGKSGVWHDVEVDDPRLARIVSRCRDLPGHELFQFLDDDGQIRTVDSDDVNEYLREIAGEHFTAKDFRTWGGTTHAARALIEAGPFLSESQAKKNIVDAVKHVSGCLGNKPAACRSYYIHPAIFEAYLDGSLMKLKKKLMDRRMKASENGLLPEEQVVLQILRNHDETLQPGDAPEVSPLCRAFPRKAVRPSQGTPMPPEARRG